jgi:hypothetical protein
MADNSLPSIRPNPEILRHLPTLRVRTPETDGETMQEYSRELGFDYRLELKLETERFRFWLCTLHTGTFPSGWHEGAVLMENVLPNEDGEHEMMPYDSENLKFLQRLDYSHLLWAELDYLRSQPFTWERDKRIEEVLKEFKRLGIEIEPRKDFDSEKGQ